MGPVSVSVLTPRKCATAFSTSERDSGIRACYNWSKNSWLLVPLIPRICPWTFWPRYLPPGRHTVTLSHLSILKNHEVTQLSLDPSVWTRKSIWLEPAHSSPLLHYRYLPFHFRLLCWVDPCNPLTRVLSSLLCLHLHPLLHLEPRQWRLSLKLPHQHSSPPL